MTERVSPLDAVHRSLEAKMVPFGGWSMPLSYPTGTLVEHGACRSSAVCFDVSHLGTVRVSGPTAFDALQRALSNDLRKVVPGRCQYTHMLNEAGGVTDDIIVWWRSEEVFDVMPNASNTDRVVGALKEAGVEAADVTAQRAILAVQGPMARSMTAELLPEASTVPRFGISEFEFDGVTCVVAGTGYTGEDGYEIAVPSDHAEALWRAIRSVGVEPAGLGARDTLRLEAGLPLHGHELSAEITPLDAGLGWVVGWDKDEFVGRDALLAQRERGTDRTLVGITTEGRRPPREDQAILIDGTEVGTVSSGNFSPTLSVGIAMGFVDTSSGAETAPGTKVEIQGRSASLAGTIVEMPFVRS